MQPTLSFHPARRWPVRRAILAVALALPAVVLAALPAAAQPASSSLFVPSSPVRAGSPSEGASGPAEAATGRFGEGFPELSAGYREEQPAGPVVVRGGEAADPIWNAVEEYRRTGEARTIQQSAYVAYPYGHSQPTLTCAPLRACVIELEAGETVLGLVAGDTERWIIGQTVSGPGGGTPLVAVKPTDHDLTTNLLVTTDRRIYELTLDAPPARRRGSRSENPQEVYTRRIRFYYPDDMVRTSAEAAASAAEAQAREAASGIVLGPQFRLENLNFNYTWQGSRRFPFEPEQVFDDGAHTYVKVPASAAHEAAPVLFVEDGGERVLVNYAVHEAGGGALFYVTDRVFQHGVLVLGDRREDWLGRSRHDEERLRITNLARR
jgi:type IV secretion system protein TrbG